jgi:two-component system chemotaxis response regulator CheY
MRLCLVVDDSQIIRKYARLIFESRGYRMIEAETPPAAIDRLAGETPHIIFVDWKIPGFNTHELISQIRKMDLSRRPFIIYLTTENNAEDINLALRAGADDYLLKPFNRDIIEIKLQEIKVAA